MSSLYSNTIFYSRELLVHNSLSNEVLLEIYRECSNGVVNAHVEVNTRFWYGPWWRVRAMIITGTRYKACYIESPFKVCRKYIIFICQKYPPSRGLLTLQGWG